MDSSFRPAVVAWEKAQSGSDTNKRFAAASLVESFGWISIGVQAAAFPADLAREIVTSSLEVLLEANELAEQEALFQSGVTVQNRRLFESKDMFPRPFCDRYSSEFSNLPEAPTLFSLWCSESLAFAQADGGLAETLNFAYDEEWRIALGRLKDEYFSPEIDLTSEPSLFEGYLRSLLHMNRVAQLMGVEGTPTAGWPARAVMRVEVTNIHGWRLNLQSNVFAPRFDAVTEVVESRLRVEAQADGIKLREGGFVDGVRNLRRRYGESLGHLSRTASG